MKRHQEEKKKSGAILAHFKGIYVIILIYEVVKQAMKT